MDPAIACEVFRSKRHVFWSSQGGAAELTNRRDAAAASLRFRRFVSSAALPWLLSKTCLLERKTPHAMARSTITPRDDRKKLHVRIASLGIQSPRCHVSNRYNHHLADHLSTAATTAATAAATAAAAAATAAVAAIAAAVTPST